MFEFELSGDKYFYILKNVTGEGERIVIHEPDKNLTLTKDGLMANVFGKNKLVIKYKAK